MKKIIFISITIIILAGTALLFGMRFLDGSEDDWICQNGEWVKHGHPDSAKPTSLCGDDKKTEMEKKSSKGKVMDAKDNLIVVTSPAPGAVISSPVEIVGEARGTWFFEGDFPITIKDKDGRALAAAPARALGEWMTTEFVPFRAIMEFSAPSGSQGTLVLTRDDPADFSVREEIEVPVTFGNAPSMKIKLFFSSNYYNPDAQKCENVYEVERVIPKTKAVAKAALEELLAGLTEGEKKAGFSTNLNPGIKVKSIAIANGTAKVDFDSKMEEGMGGSCRTAAVRAQIEETLKQFPTVKSVIISVDGRTEDILQP